jgi:hypothetical protein
VATSTVSADAGCHPCGAADHRLGDRVDVHDVLVAGDAVLEGVDLHGAGV